MGSISFVGADRCVCPLLGRAVGLPHSNSNNFCSVSSSSDAWATAQVVAAHRSPAPGFRGRKFRCRLRCAPALAVHRCRGRFAGERREVLRSSSGIPARNPGNGGDTRGRLKKVSAATRSAAMARVRVAAWGRQRGRAANRGSDSPPLILAGGPSARGPAHRFSAPPCLTTRPTAIRRPMGTHKPNKSAAHEPSAIGPAQQAGYQP